MKHAPDRPHPNLSCRHAGSQQKPASAQPCLISPGRLNTGISSPPSNHGGASESDGGGESSKGGSHQESPGHPVQLLHIDWDYGGSLELAVRIERLGFKLSPDPFTPPPISSTPPVAPWAAEGASAASAGAAEARAVGAGAGENGTEGAAAATAATEATDTGAGLNPLERCLLGLPLAHVRPGLEAPWRAGPAHVKARLAAAAGRPTQAPFKVALVSDPDALAMAPAPMMIRAMGVQALEMRDCK